jgi:hypothetical protein
VIVCHDLCRCPFQPETWPLAAPCALAFVWWWTGDRYAGFALFSPDSRLLLFAAAGVAVHREVADTIPLYGILRYKSCVSNMTKTKRKVRRIRHRPSPGWMSGDGFTASIVGDQSRKLYHFTSLDIGEPLPFQSLERAVFVRTFR